MAFGKGEEGVGDLLLLVWLGGMHGGSVGPDLSAELGWGVEILMGACFGVGRVRQQLSEDSVW